MREAAGTRKFSAADLPASSEPQRFAIPKLRNIDAALVTGAALFGVGWGLGGYCPGPGAGRGDALVFIVAMAIGWLLTAPYDVSKTTPKAERNASSRASVPAK